MSLIYKFNLIFCFAAFLFAAANVYAKQGSTMSDNKKTLIVYFSHSGNTKSVAERIGSTINADLARIETIKPYTGTMDEVSAQGKKEVENGYLPEIKQSGIDINNYDRIVIGTPTWWYTMAPAVLSFLRQTDFKGKDVVLYMTNAGWRALLLKICKKKLKGQILLPQKKSYLIRTAAIL